MSDRIEFPEANIRTPKFKAIWPNIDKPNTRFNADGVYEVKGAFTEEEFEAIKTRLDKLLQQTVQEVHKVVPKAKKANVLTPYEEELDDNGDETGRYILKLKRNAAFKGRDGEMVHTVVQVFDPAGNRMKPVPGIGGGSTLLASFRAKGFYVPAIGIGVSLRLNAVQLLNLIPKGDGGGSAEDFGFGTDGESFVQEVDPDLISGSDGSDEDNEEF